MESFFNTFVGKIIRWLILFPIAVLASGLINAIVILTQGDWLIVSIIAQIIAGFSYILIGVIIAPNFKRTVAITLSVFILLASLFSLSTYLGYIDSDFHAIRSWQDILASIGCLVGVGFGLLMTVSKKDKY